MLLLQARGAGSPEFTDMEAAEVLRYLGSAATEDGPMSPAQDGQTSSGHRSSQENAISKNTVGRRSAAKRKRSIAMDNIMDNIEDGEISMWQDPSQVRFYIRHNCSAQ